LDRARFGIGCRLSNVGHRMKIGLPVSRRPSASEIGRVSPCETARGPRPPGPPDRSPSAPPHGHGPSRCGSARPSSRGRRREARATSGRWSLPRSRHPCAGHDMRWRDPRRHGRVPNRLSSATRSRRIRSSCRPARPTRASSLAVTIDEPHGPAQRASASACDARRTRTSHRWPASPLPSMRSLTCPIPSF